MARRYRLAHLELRGHQYHARLNVPAEVQGKLGKRRFRKALGTTDQVIATRLAAALVAEWQVQIELARGRPKDIFMRYRQALKDAKNETERDEIMDAANTEATLLGVSRAEPGQDPMDVPAAREFYERAIGWRIGTAEHLEEWLATLRVEPKTLHMRRNAIDRLAVKMPTLTDITRRSVRQWSAELRHTLSAGTVARLMSACNLYWGYLRDIEVIAEGVSPFRELKLKVAQDQEHWQPYEPADAVRLLAAANGELRDLVDILMYTGARREEICALRIERIQGDRFEVVDAKTPAGNRIVPIHPEIAPVFQRLISERKSGYLFAGLREAGNHGRGHAIGKRFGRLKTKLGFGERHSIHSLRGTVITMLERAGVPEGTVQDIVGHERTNITGAIYSGKSTFEMRAEAIAKLCYPDA